MSGISARSESARDRSTARVANASSRVQDRSGISNEDLAVALMAGDQEAFELLIERETTRVFRACYRVLGRIDEAEESAQEAFVLAYRALGSYRGEGHPGAWLMRIATREAWRRASARTRIQSVTSTLDTAVLAIPTSRDDPSEEAIASQERERVHAAVTALPEPYREIITLRYFGDLSLKQICVATGRPEGTVKAQLHRGLRRLRELLDEDVA